MPIPPDTRAPGDTGHIADHNAISDELTALAAGLALIPIASGGTGQTTRQAALDAITGTQSSGTVLRSDGTHATLAAIQAADVPTLNQSTTGTAAAANALKSATTTVNTSSATAPTSGQVLTATGGTAATWQTPSGGGGVTAVQTTSAGSGTVTLNAASYAAVVLTLTGGSVTLALSGASAGNEASIVLYTVQSGGSWTVTWPTVTWVGGVAPSVPSSGVGIFTFTSPDNGTTWYGAQVTAAPALPLSVSNGGTGLASAGAAGTFLSSTGLTSAGAYTGLIPPGTVQTSNFTATLGQLNEADATSGNITATLPVGAASGQLAAVKMINTASSHTTTIQPTAPDIIGRATGWTSGSYATSASLSLTGQGQLLAYNAAGPAWAAGFTASSANITITAGSAPFAVGQLVYFTAGTIPTGLTASTPYYVVSVTGPVSGVYTIKVDSTSGGTGIAPSSTGTAVLVQSCGNWTTVADDLPLSQLDTRYQNQNTTGKSAATDALNSATTVVNVASATAPTSGQVLTATSGTAATWQAASGGTPSVYVPSDYSLLAWSYDPAMHIGNSTVTGGVVQLVKVILRATTTVTNVVLFVGAVGVTLTTNQNFAGLYNSSGTLLSATADQSTPWVSTGLKTMALTSTQTNLAAGSYWVGFVFNGTTSPSFARAASTTLTGAFINAGLTAATNRFATNSTGITTLANVTMSSNGQAASAIWAAVS